MREKSNRRTVRSRAVMTFALALAAGGMTAGAVRPAHACFHGVISPRQQLIVFWHDGVETMVWRPVVTTPNAPGSTATSGHPVASATPFAWVIAVPSAPIAYDTASGSEFSDAYRWIGGRLHIDAATMGEGGRRGLPGSGGINVGPMTAVGNYTVVPIQGTGAAAGVALNNWLRTNGFPTVSGPAVQAYLNSNATFLAVRSTLPASAQGEMEPLIFSFRSPEVVFPMRMYAGAPAFEFHAAVFSTRTLQVPASMPNGIAAHRVTSIGATNVPPQGGRSAVVTWVSFPHSIRTLIERLAPRVPQLQPILQQSLSFVYLTNQATTISPTTPDLSIPLGAPVPVSAPAAVLP